VIGDEGPRLEQHTPDVVECRQYIVVLVYPEMSNDKTGGTVVQ
jgi:hypothetical protein